MPFPANEAERAPFTEYMKYDERGQQVAHLSFEGKVTQFIYDNVIPGGSGRITEQRYFDNLAAYDGGGGTTAEKMEFRYDTFGRTIEKRWIRSATVTDVWTTQFDAFGRVTKETSPQGTVNYSYDHLGRKTQMFTTVSETGGGTNVTNDTRFEYDVLGRLAKVSVIERNDAAVSPAEDTTYRYDLAGNLDYQTSPDGIVADQVYDALFRLDKLTNYRPDTNTPGTFTDNPKLAEFDYTVRSDGKRTNATEKFWLDADNDPQTAPTPHMNTIAWSYDGAGRLTDEVFDHYDNSLDLAEHYDFDLTGNRLRKTLDTGAFVSGAPASPAVIDEAIHYLYDANDRLLEEQLDADNDGNVDETTEYAWNATQQISKSVTPTGSSTPSSTQTFTYNLQGRMSGIELSDFDVAGQLTRKQTLTYSYGPDGIRVATTDAIDTDGDGDIDPPRTKTEFLIDTHDATGYQQIIQEVTTNADTGAEINRVIYNIGLDQISQTTYTPGGPSDGETLFFHIDGHGSNRVLTDAAGAIDTATGALQLFHFDAYGNLLGFNPAQAATTFLYNNEQRDTVTGFYNFRARPYDTVTGRLIGLDAFAGNSQDPQSYHKYGFVHGDPIQGIDPTGLAEFTIVGVNISITLPTATSFSSFAAMKAYTSIVFVELSLQVGQLAFLYEVFDFTLTLTLLGIDALPEDYVNPNHGTNRPVEPYEVGEHDDLLERARANGQTSIYRIHHAPQKKPASIIINGYQPLPSGNEPCIVVPINEHTDISRAQATNSLDKFQSIPSQEDLVARDFFHIRKYTAAPVSSLKNLAGMVRGRYPSLFYRFKR